MTSEAATLAVGQRVSYVGIFGHKVAGVVIGTTRDPWADRELVLMRVTATGSRSRGYFPGDVIETTRTWLVLR